VVDRNTNYLIWNLRAGRKALEQSADIVHVEAGAGFGFARLRSSRDAPFVLQAQGLEEFKAPWLKRTAYLPLRLATLYASRRAARIIVPDQVMEKEVRKILSVEPERCVVVPLAIDLEKVERTLPDETRRAIDERCGLENHLVILSVGRVEPYKGFTCLAEALAQAKSEIPRSWKWILVGGGPQKDDLQRKVLELGIADQTVFAGQVTDTELAAIYERADLFVHPTLFEGSSLVTLEAMAHAKPVIATAVGGIPDKVVEAKSGFLVPPGDSESLSRAITQAFSLGANLEELGAEGRKIVETKFTWSHRAGRLLELYREVASSP
jgi:glycosyltransferase involved in cell wall biosynthesis